MPFLTRLWPQSSVKTSEIDLFCFRFTQMSRLLYSKLTCASAAAAEPKAAATGSD